MESMVWVLIEHVIIMRASTSLNSLLLVSSRECFLSFEKGYGIMGMQIRQTGGRIFRFCEGRQGQQDSGCRSWNWIDWSKGE